ALLKAQPEEAVMRVTAAKVDLPIKGWSRRGIENYAALCRDDEAGHREFGSQFALAIETWRTSMIKRLERNEPANISVELRLLSFNRSSFLTVNAEIFSRFSELMNAKTH